MKKILLLAVTSFLLASCTEQSTEQPKTESKQVYIGRFSYGPEVSELQPCNSETVHWINLGGYGDEMLDYYIKHRKEPYQKMYVQLDGFLEGQAVEGIAAEYDNVLRVTEKITEYSFDIPAECK